MVLISVKGDIWMFQLYYSFIWFENKSVKLHPETLLSTRPFSVKLWSDLSRYCQIEKTLIFICLVSQLKHCWNPFLFECCMCLSPFLLYSVELTSFCVGPTVLISVVRWMFRSLQRVCLWWHSSIPFSALEEPLGPGISQNPLLFLPVMDQENMISACSHTHWKVFLFLKHSAFSCTLASTLFTTNHNLFTRWLLLSHCSKSN